MIYEIRDVKQESADETLRWFTDNDFWDIYTWNRPGESIHRFQIYFNRQVNEKGILWDNVNGISSARVGDETTHYSADWGTPVLYPEKIEKSEIAGIIDGFKKDSTGIPEEVRSRILSVFTEIVEN